MVQRESLNCQSGSCSSSSNPCFPGKLRILQGQKCWQRKGDFHERYVLSSFQSSVPHPSQCPVLLFNPETKAAVFLMTMLSFTSVAFPTNDPMILLWKMVILNSLSNLDLFSDHSFFSFSFSQKPSVRLKWCVFDEPLDKF